MDFLRFLWSNLVASFFIAGALILGFLGYADQARDIWAGAQPWQLHAGGAALFVIAVVIILYRNVQEHQRRTASAAVAPTTAPKAELPPLKTERKALEPVAAAPVTRTSVPLDASKTFVGENVTPAYLMEKFQSVTELQAQRTVSVYIDKWMRISGTINNISDFKSSIHVTVNVPFRFKGTELETQIWLVFKGDREALEVAHVGDPIQAIGRISEIRSSMMRLEDCELLR